MTEFLKRRLSFSQLAFRLFLPELATWFAGQSNLSRTPLFILHSRIALSDANHSSA